MALNPNAVSFQPSFSPTQAVHAEEEDNDSKKRKRKGRTEATPKQILMRQVGQACKKNDPIEGLRAYREAKQTDGLIIPPEVYNMIIALLSGMSNHIKEAEVSEEHCNAALELYEEAKSNDVKLQEAAFTSLLRICRHRGDISLSLQLLSELKNSHAGKTIRLRTFLPVLSLFVDQNDCKGAFEIYQSILENQLVVGEREYVLLLRVATAVQDSVRGEQVLRALAEDCLRPSRVNTWPVLIDWFNSPASYRHSEETGDRWRVVRKGEPMGVDEESGTWGKTSGDELKKTKEYSLLSIDLSNDEKLRMMNTIGRIAIENNRTAEEEATKKWAAFQRWLNKQGKNSFDVIIDGANVGYYKQNYKGAPKHVNYDQIDWILRHFQRLGHKPLIILHQRHLFIQNLPKEFVAMTQRWRDEGVLYSTPSGANDDWYWLYAALWLNLDGEGSSEVVSSGAEETETSPNQGAPTISNSLSSGTHKLFERLHFVSNDEMRDHYFCLPSKTVSVADVHSFMRWKERHQCHFDFGLYNKQERTKEVFIFSPTSFSIRMQCSTNQTLQIEMKEMKITNDTRGETNTSSTPPPVEKVMAWHIPCWKEDPSSVDFVGHEYSHAEEFANLSKPADPLSFEWISFIRESFFGEDIVQRIE